MVEPSPRTIRRILTGAFAAALVVGGAGFLLGRSTSERTPEIVAPAPVAAPAPEPESFRLPAVLGRSDLIALAAAAADAVASGGKIQPQLEEADGRRFRLRLPFGCDGPAARDSNADLRWRYDPKAGALRIHVAAVAWPLQHWSIETPPPEGDASKPQVVEGFWIERPWTSSESCPPTAAEAAASDSAAAADPVSDKAGSVGKASDADEAARASSAPAAGAGSSPALPDRTLALGQLLPARSTRDGRVYDAVVKVAENELDTSRGFSLRIAGRISRLPAGGTVRCHQPTGPDQRPACLVGVVIDEVAIENPATGKTLATWSPAPRHTPGR